MENTYAPANANNPETYLSSRVDDQINWYSKRSGQLKKRYRRLKGLTIVVGGLIPVCIALSDRFGDLFKYLAGIFGALISIFEGISGMLKDKETYLAYRAASEALLREKMQYQSASGRYAEAANRFIVFVEACENIMAGENAQWVSVQLKEKDQQQAG